MAKSFIPYSRQCIEPDDIRAVADALGNELITQGPLVQRFEEAVADYAGARYAVAFSNGTAALHACVHAAGLKEGDEGIVPPVSFAATANCLQYVGANPVFADVTSKLPLIDPAEIEKKITEKTKAILPVHFAGAACDMESIAALASRKNITVIEDACHALGAHYESGGERVKIGSCRHSAMTVFSFHPVKNITTGEGGIVTTNDAGLLKTLKAFRHHGITAGEFPDKPGWYYEMRDLGYNFRLTELQAALGISQLQKSDRFLSAREALFKNYEKAFSKIKGARLLLPPKAIRSALHLCILILDDAQNRDPLFNDLRANGIGCQLHYIPIYRHPYYQKKFPVDPGDFPNSERYFHAAVSIPLFPQMTAAEQERVIQAVEAGLKKLAP